jgi:predicted RNase H-like nuclease (RuvC/YqgF family)
MNTRSNGGADRAPVAPVEWGRLQSAIQRLLEEHRALRTRAEAAEERVRDLESALSRVASGDLDPVALSEQVRTFDRENRALEKRLEDARTVVDRIQSRLQFLEEDR